MIPTMKSEPMLSMLPMQKEWRTAALPVAFVLFAVEMQRHWHGNVRWFYLAAVVLLAVSWLFTLAGREWAIRHVDTAIDAAIFLILLGGGWMTLVLGERDAIDLLMTLTFWAPLICVWWALSCHDHIVRLVANAIALYAGLFLVHNASDAFFEYVILGVLLILLVRFAGERYQRLLSAAKAAQLPEALMRDAVTGVASPAYFEAELAQTSAIADRYRIPFSLIACQIDLDPPTTAGFAAASGQELLKAIAWMITDRVRIADTVCRWTGGKFMVLLPNTLLPDANQVAESIRTACRAFAASHEQALQIRIGVCEHCYGEDPMLSFAMAEKALALEPATDSRLAKA